MENNKDNGMSDEENLRGQQENTAYEDQKANTNDNSETRASGDDIISEGLDNKHHQQHGNRKYESFTNHSSADDQPGNTTDTNLGREHNF